LPEDASPPIVPRSPQKSLLDRRAVAGWCLYDFSNSIYVAVVPATIWSAYYANRIVGNDAGQGDLWWGRVVSISMLLVALTSPPMGAVGDFAGARKKLLIVYATASALATIALATVAPGMIVWGFVLSVLATVGLEGSMVFYNAYLPEIAPRSHQGRVSGWGFAVGYAGSLLGLLGVLPLVQRDQFAAAFVLTGVAYLIFALPAFVYLPRDQPARLGARAAMAGGIRESWKTFRDILEHRDLRRFLLAYLIYEDGVTTVVYFSSIFAAKTLGFPMTDLLLLYAAVQISALAGALAWAKPTDRLGPKFVVQAMLLQWIFVVAATYFVETRVQFFIVAIAAGTGLGAIQAASRAFMSTLIPAGREGEFFGFYNLCGKSAAVLGPLVFGTVSAATGGNQRLAILSVLAFYVVGGLILRSVRAGGPTQLSAPASIS
jgi:UMF1 family MFS transporter